MTKGPSWQFFRHCWTDSLRIGIDPLKRERAALVGLYRVDAAEVVGREVDTRPVRTAFEHKAFSVGGDFRLALYEVALAHAEKRRDAGNLRVRHADNAVLDPTARPAAAAMEVDDSPSCKALRRTSDGARGFAVHAVKIADR